MKLLYSGKAMLQQQQAGRYHGLTENRWNSACTVFHQVGDDTGGPYFLTLQQKHLYVLIAKAQKFDFFTALWDSILEY